MEEKEIYVIKTCDSGKPVFQVMGLEEPDDTSATGLKRSLDSSVEKLNFTFDRKDRQVGNGSDGAAVNNALFRLEREDLGDHLILGWCANHKTELGIHDAFKPGQLNKASEELANNAFYLFKKANLKWRLFKRQAKFMNVKCLKFKRPSGTQWVAHQVDSLNNYLRNLPTFLGFLHQQIQSLFNKTMKNAKSTLEGHLKAASRLGIVIYMAAKRDLLAYLSPFSQALEKKELLAPEALSSMKNAIQVMAKIKQILEDKGSAGFYTEGLFPTLHNLVLPHLESSDDVLPVRTTRADDGTGQTDLQTFHEYGMTTGLEAAFNKVTTEITELVRSLEENLTQRFSDFVESPVYHAAAVLLDTKNYQFQPVQVLFENAEVVQQQFSTLLLAKWKSCARSSHICTIT